MKVDITTKIGILDFEVGKLYINKAKDSITSDHIYLALEDNIFYDLELPGEYLRQCDNFSDGFDLRPLPVGTIVSLTQE